MQHPCPPVLRHQPDRCVKGLDRQRRPVRSLPGPHEVEDMLAVGITALTIWGIFEETGWPACFSEIHRVPSMASRRCSNSPRRRRASVV